MKRQHSDGFTLLEVLVAIVILSIALTSIIEVLSAHITSVSSLTARTFGNWTAANAVESLKLDKGLRYGTFEQRERMGHFDWVVEITVERTSVNGMARVAATARTADGDMPGGQLVTYMQVQE